MVGDGNRRSADVDALVRQALADPDSGWWFAAVLEAFDYLESEFGYCLAAVHRHFRGDFVRYEGPTLEVVISYDPEDTGHIGAELWAREDLRVEPQQFRSVTVNHVLRGCDPTLRLPEITRGNKSRAEALDALDTWSVGLRVAAPDVLLGESPPGW